MTAENKRGILLSIVYIITAIMLALGVYSVYNLIAVQKPWTLGVTYAGAISTDDTQANIIDVNIKSNANNNGEVLYEIQFNSYTDTDGSGIAGFGIQVVGSDYALYNMSDLFNNTGLVNFESAQKKYDRMLNQNSSYIFGDVYLYYTGDNGKVYRSLNVSELDDYLLIDIDGAYYRLVLNDYPVTTTSGTLWWEKEEVTYVQYSWFDVFDYIIQSALSNSATEVYEKFALPLFDLSDFLKIEYKDEDGQYKQMLDTAENRNYMTIQVTYDKDGAVETSDSMFNMVGSSSTWSYYNEDYIKDYWQATSSITITDSMLNYTYNDLYEAYFLTLDPTFVEYLQNSKNEINITLDLSNKVAIDYAGIDLQYFDFNIKSFEIINAPSDFIIIHQDYCEIEPEVTYGS